MSRYLPYSPDQAYLVPPSVQDELGAGHLCFFVHKLVEHLDLAEFERSYSAEGGALYAPALMLKVWLYGYALGITSARRLEQRIVEDLAFRYLAGGARPDNWALSAFRRRHARALNDAFTQVLEAARHLGLGRLGTVAIDSTRIQACARRDRLDTEPRLRRERVQLRRQVRRWQQQCDADDSNEGGGSHLPVAALEKQLAGIPQRLERLRKSGQAKLSRTDTDARFLRARQGFVLGYTGELAVSEDHLIVAARVTQNAMDQPALAPLVAEVEGRCGALPERVLADAGFCSKAGIAAVAHRGIDVYIPDSNLARELNTGERARGTPVSDPAVRRMRAKLRSPAGRRIYGRRKALVEPVFGTLKTQRAMHRFRLRSLAKVQIEWTLAAMAYNITRLARP